MPSIYELKNEFDQLWMILEEELVDDDAIISAFGALIGIVTGVALSLAQQHFGLISLGDGAMIVDSYPVVIIPGDVAMTFFTVIAVGFLTVWLPVKALTKKYI